MTGADLPAALADFPASWAPVLPGWTPALAAQIVAAVQRVSGDRPIAPADPFRALRLVAPDAVKVVVLGQDPYPTAGHADGLAFSAGRGKPRSLARIFEVLAADRPAFQPPEVWSLDGWARQGVLLLNPVLTVEVGRAGSHERCGWQALTSQVVSALCARAHPPVFLLWGSRALAFFDRACAAGSTATDPPQTEAPPVSPAAVTSVGDGAAARSVAKGAAARPFAAGPATPSIANEPVSNSIMDASALIADRSPAKSIAGGVAGKPVGADEPRVRVLVTRHPSYDFHRDFMRACGSHFVATQDLVDWWDFSRPEGHVV